MSDSDSFIEEVTEEVRRDRLFALMRRYGWIGIGLVLLIVGGASWNEWQKATARSEAEAFGDALLEATAAEPGGGRAEKLKAIAATGERGALVAFLTAADELAANDRPAALAALQAVATDASLPVSYRDLAALKHLLVGGDSLPEADRRAVLAELSLPGRPYRVLAEEQIALLDVESGETEAALTRLKALGEDQEATRGLLARVSQLIVTLEGDANTE
ncbi:MAG: hypothetical protein R3D84_13205 [Paracoccaceae bacterium]